MKISQTITELWGVQEFFGEMLRTSKGHNSKTREGQKIILIHDASSSPKSHSYDIPLRYPNQLQSYGVYMMKITQHKDKNQSNGQNSETEKWKVTILYDVHSYKVS